MRRSTSALTTTILGAVFSASTVSAQQSLPSATARRPAPATTARRAAPATTAPRPPAATFRLQGADEADPDPGFGMAAARGPRYLLHNGLDYIGYQEYDRALRYLREAEKRQGELNKTEKLKLTQAIERAQRGLRESIGSEPAYAISQRSARPAGVVPAAAQSQTRIAAAAPAPARDASVSPAKASTVRREGDDQVEPIRLTAAELPAGNGSDDQARARADARAGLPPIPGAPTPLPDVPQAPATPQPLVADDRGQAASPALDLADAPPVTRIQLGAPDDREAPAPASDPVGQPPVLAPSQPIEAASFGVGAVSAPPVPEPEPAAAMPELAAAEPAVAAAPIAVSPASVDESVTLSNASPEPTAPAPAPITLETPEEAATPAPSAVPPLDVEPLALPPLGASTPTAPAPVPVPAPAMLDELEAPRTAAVPSAAELDLPALPSDLRDRGVGSVDAALTPLPEPAADLPQSPAGPSGAPVDLPQVVAPPAGLSTAQPEAVPAEPEPEPEAAPAAPSTEELLAPEPAVDPIQEVPAPAPVAEAVEGSPAPAPEPVPADEPAQVQPTVDPVEVPAQAPAPGASTGFDSFLPARANPVSTLSPELQGRVDEVARRIDDETRIAQSQPAAAVPPPPAAAPYDPNSDLRSQTQIDISRAPSPAEARPIRAIPVPEDWVPLGARDWSSQRKYWAAAATCHMPLYFQDPMLERYGHSVEHFVGPLGRFMAYPVDKHTQTTQRNQIAQPFASIGLFAGQILALPYNLIMDPPWEAQYDLGYWRPGDKIPTDMYYLPTHGIGPPLKGKNY